MRLPDGQEFGHSVPKDRDLARYKVVYTRAEFSSGGLLETENILHNALNKHALVEVHVNLRSEVVESTSPPPEQSFYPDIQVPVF